MYDVILDPFYCLAWSTVVPVTQNDVTIDAAGFPITGLRMP